MQTKIICIYSRLMCRVDIVCYLDLEQLPANEDDEADACQTNSCFANFVQLQYELLSKTVIFRMPIFQLINCFNVDKSNNKNVFIIFFSFLLSFTYGTQYVRSVSSVFVESNWNSLHSVGHSPCKHSPVYRHLRLTCLLLYEKFSSLFDFRIKQIATHLYRISQVCRLPRVGRKEVRECRT